MRINYPLECLPDMAAFACVVDSGSFSAAAIRLGVTPSAVSRQIARLEALLQVRLLERTTRKLRLTDAGAAAYERCQNMVSAAREVLALSDTQTATPRGMIRVSMPKAIGRLLIHPWMPEFLQRHPEVSVHMVVTDRTVDLFAEAIDLAIRVTDAPPPGLAGRPLTRIRHLLCASPQYLLLRGTPAHPRDLPAHDCLYLGEDERDRHWRFCRATEDVSVKVSGRYIANHSEMRLEGALHHLGIASLPEFTARAALKTGTLIEVLADWEHRTDYAGTAWLLYPSNRYPPAKLRAWIDFIVEKMA